MVKIEDNMKNTPPRIIERKLPQKVIKKVQTHRLISQNYVTEPDKVETEKLGSQMKEQDTLSRKMVDFRNEFND